VPLWFAWFWIFFFWLFYLCADSTNVKVFDNHYENNRWTSMTFYSLANLAHEEYYTRLSRVTVVLINWTIQGVIIASIYGNQFLDAPMIIWTAAIAFVATLPVPFLIGYLIHKKIYEKNLIKYENMKAMKGVIDKDKLEPHEQAIDTCEEKLYGYYHWLYSTALVLLFVCFPIAINQMQKLPRMLYHYHWYWYFSLYSGWPPWALSSSLNTSSMSRSSSSSPATPMQCAPAEDTSIILNWDKPIAPHRPIDMNI
jgi:hypothetical protein